jgi:hypothetical protein
MRPRRHHQMEPERHSPRRSPPPMLLWLSSPPHRAPTAATPKRCVKLNAQILVRHVSRGGFCAGGCRRPGATAPNGVAVSLAGLADPRPARQAPDAPSECRQGCRLSRALSPNTHVPARHVVADGCSEVFEETVYRSQPKSNNTPQTPTRASHSLHSYIPCACASARARRVHGYNDPY